MFRFGLKRLGPSVYKTAKGQPRKNVRPVFVRTLFSHTEGIGDTEVHVFFASVLYKAVRKILKSCLVVGSSVSCLFRQCVIATLFPEGCTMSA